MLASLLNLVTALLVLTVIIALLNLVTALLVLTVIIALLGIVNTLALSVVERTRELGLLRAIGMRRGQLAQMIAAESVIIAIIGAVLGTALGLGLGAALADAFTRAQQATVVISPGQIIAYMVAAALAGWPRSPRHGVRPGSMS